MKQKILIISTLIFLSFSACAQENEQTFKEELKQFRENMRKKMSKENWDKGEKVGADAAKEVRASGVTEKTLKVGQRVPTIVLNDAFGKSVNVNKLLKKGPVVMVFYRGSWCPFCNLYLRAIQKKLPEIKNYGANLVAVTGKLPDMKFEKEKLKYSVLSDPQYEVSRKFGLVYEIPKELDNYYQKIGLDLAKKYGTEKPEMMMSAVYIVDRKKRVRYMKADVDYKNWAEPNEILEVLEKLKK